MNLMTNKQLQQSMDKVFKSDDQRVIDSGIKIASETLGADAARYGIELTSALTGVYGPKIWKNISRSQLEDKLHPYLPHMRATRSGAIEVTFRDRSALHLHDDQAIYSIEGMEFPLHSSSRGTDMNILGSVKGRQVIKGWREVELNEPLARVFTQKTRIPFKADINPELGVTRVDDFGKTWIYKHPESDLSKNPSQKFSSCCYCDPFNPTNR